MKMKILAVLVLLILPGCRVSTRHIAVVADRGIYETLNDIHAEEQAALCGLPSCAASSKVEALSGWTLAKSQSFNKKLLPAVEGGRQYNRLLASWKPGTPVPDGVTALIGGLGDALTIIVAEFPAGTSRDKIAKEVVQAQQVILNAFQIIIAVKGVQ